jgi:putative PIN family toxin of toxin-antitoxin system
VRVVLDTNVFVSAAISTGAPHRVVQAWLDRRPFDVVMCPELLAEVTEVMTERPKLRRWLSLDDARAFVDRLATETVMVDDPASVESTTRDQDDDYLIALARQQEADFLVSGDLDLLCSVLACACACARVGAVRRGRTAGQVACEDHLQGEISWTFVAASGRLRRVQGKND